MEAGETLQVKEGVDQETIDAVREVSTYKYGWDTDIEMAVSYTHLRAHET